MNLFKSIKCFVVEAYTVLCVSITAPAPAPTPTPVPTEVSVSTAAPVVVGTLVHSPAGALVHSPAGALTVQVKVSPVVVVSVPVVIIAPAEITSSKGKILALLLKGKTYQYWTGYEYEDLYSINIVDGVPKLVVENYLNLEVDFDSDEEWGFAPAQELPIGINRLDTEITNTKGIKMTLRGVVLDGKEVMYNTPYHRTSCIRTVGALTVTKRVEDVSIYNEAWGFVPAEVTPYGRALFLQEEEARVAEEVKARKQAQERALILKEEMLRISTLTAGHAAYRVQKRVKYLDLFNLLMVDWDPAPHSGSYDARHFTISSIEEVEELLLQRVTLHPDELWKAYLTPSGGVHAFRVSHLTPMSEGIDIIKSLQGDLLYAGLIEARQTYSVRVSAKYTVDGSLREGDYVAKYWKSFGKGVALPENEVVMTLHDSFLP